MAATCIGVFLLAIMLEFVRRVGKEYDQFIVLQFQKHVNARAAMSRSEDDCCSGGSREGSQTVTFRATLIQQLIRSFIRKSHLSAMGTIRRFCLFYAVLSSTFTCELSCYRIYTVSERC